MKNERTNKKRYKIITYFCVFLLVVVAGVGFALGKTQNKVKAGVIIDETFTLIDIDTTTLAGRTIYANEIESKMLAFASWRFDSPGWQLELSFKNANNNSTSIYVFLQLLAQDMASPRVIWKTNSFSGTYTTSDYAYFTTYDNKTYLVLSLNTMVNNITEKLRTDRNDNSYNFEKTTLPASYITNFQMKYATMGVAITQSQNIFDLPNNALVLLYINDVSGLNTSEMRDEITINWGYIDQSDNTLYAEYAPTISAQNMQTDNKIIRIGVPLNAVGDAMDFYDISQKALLNISSLPEGSATAQAHIYGVYVWHNSNDIKWGLAEFNTQVDPVPGSALNMNYITSLTELFDYQNTNTGTMTCRLSVSSNFNFITIKNQTNGPNKDNINAVIQQGGFLPAWSVYNWARGTYSGFIAGDASARADYVEGKPGYDAIYQAGFSDGFANAELGTANWFITSFKAVDAFLSIHIFPNITFGVLLGIPFVISLAWFIIRMFRGGGGD